MVLQSKDNYKRVRLRPNQTLYSQKSAYRPETKGGAGTIHWPSHCKAFYAEWIIRLLHPRQAPWKQVFRSWYPDWNNLGDGLMTASAGDRCKLLDYIPSHAHYIRRCVVEFNQLKLTQNLDLKDNTILAEPLWLNSRFTIPLPDARLAIWLHEQELTHVANLFDPATDQIHSLRNWYRYFRTHSPHQRPDIMRGEPHSLFSPISLGSQVSHHTHRIVMYGGVYLCKKCGATGKLKFKLLQTSN